MQKGTHSPGALRSDQTPEWRDEDAYGLPRANFPGGGIVVLIGVILMGLIPAAYYIWARPRMEKAYSAKLAEAPTTARGRLEKWFEFGAAMIHHRLTRIGRFSSEYPWIVTHTIRGEGGMVEAFGLDLSNLDIELSRLDGMTVVVELPGPGPLGPMLLRGERARYVPVFDAGDEIPDMTLRVRELALWFLEDLPKALEVDIEGASLELVIGGVVVVPRAPASQDPSPLEGTGEAESIQPSGPDGR